MADLGEEPLAKPGARAQPHKPPPATHPQPRKMGLEGWCFS
jgi:hypothetical protein